VDIKAISQRLGHSSIRITYDLYSHFLPTAQKDATTRLESLLKSNLGTKNKKRPRDENPGSLDSTGADGEIRTHDLRITSAVKDGLYSFAKERLI